MTFSIGQLVVVDNCGTLLEGVIKGVGREMYQVEVDLGTYSTTNIFHGCKIYPRPVADVSKTLQESICHILKATHCVAISVMLIEIQACCFRTPEKMTITPCDDGVILRIPTNLNESLIDLARSQKVRIRLMEMGSETAKYMCYRTT